MDETTQDNPGVIAPPPALYAGTFALGLLLNHFLRLRVPGRVARRIFGPLLLAGSVGLAVWGFRTMLAAGTNVDPREPATTIVQSGPFRLSRNPLYLSLTGMYVGLALTLNRLTALLLLPCVLSLMTKGVIEREERYLDAKFGKEYREYRTRVRRWL